MSNETRRAITKFNKRIKPKAKKSVTDKPPLDLTPFNDLQSNYVTPIKIMFLLGFHM